MESIFPWGRNGKSTTSQLLRSGRISSLSAVRSRGPSHMVSVTAITVASDLFRFRAAPMTESSTCRPQPCSRCHPGCPQSRRTRPGRHSRDPTRMRLLTPVTEFGRHFCPVSDTYASGTVLRSNIYGQQMTLGSPRSTDTLRSLGIGVRASCPV